MSFILSIEAIRKAVGVAFSISRVTAFVSATKDVVMQIGSNEFNAANRSLENMEISYNPMEELHLAIGHFQSAYEHFKAKSNNSIRFICLPALKRSYQTALLIAICYQVKGEKKLCNMYLKESNCYFSKWVEYFHIHYTCGKTMLSRIKGDYEEAKSEVISLGLAWPYSAPKFGFWESVFSEGDCIELLHNTFDNHINKIKSQYYDFSHKLLE